eukprot:scaffold2349_cov110-Cylindrotheca_fusiformis.AAC.2
MKDWTTLEDALSSDANLWQKRKFRRLARIVAVGQENGLGASLPSESANLVDLAGHSYGITSDPLTQFAVVFSAIIHDVDHPGVSNAQLVKENTRCAQIYKQSIAEQKSVDIAWDMLMEDRYADLRACIYQTEEDLHRFRQLVVNTVMATDIVDKELQALRKVRWETAFDCKPGMLDDGVDSDDRKATIVIEHFIRCRTYHAALVHIQEMERAVLHGMLPCLPRRQGRL